MTTGQQVEPIERASRDEICNLQLKRLRQTLEQAQNTIPFYQQNFSAVDFHPQDIHTLSDLQNLPFTTKADMRAAYPFGLLAVSKRHLARLHASSGTTGRPTVVGYTRGDLETWAQLMARCLRAAGVRPGMLLHNAYGYGLFTGGLGVHGGAEALGVAVVPVSGGATQRQVTLIHDFRPHVIGATPSYMLTLLDAFRDMGLAPEEASLRIGLFGAEPWSEGMRREIEQAFGMEALDLYGLSEVLGPGVACECIETKNGLHLWEDHFYPEIIDPETGRVLPDGEEGELVLTTLTREASPLIRYRTRDITRLLPGTTRSMRRLARISGRTDDMLIIRGVNLFPSQIEGQILKTPGLAPHYQIEISRERRMDAMTVHVERTPDRAGPEAQELVAAELSHTIKSALGVSVRIALQEPGTIERSRGKARRVIDRRHSDDDSP